MTNADAAVVFCETSVLLVSVNDSTEGQSIAKRKIQQSFEVGS